MGGNRLNFRLPLEGVLRDISAAFQNFSALQSIVEPHIETRTEMVKAFQTATALHLSGVPRFGRTAFGLGTLIKIVGSAPIVVQASMLIVWDRYRVAAKNMLSYSDIVGLATVRERD